MVIIFCGIPGSGKTTAAKILAKRLKKLGRAALFVSDKLKPPVYKKFFKLLKENLGKYDYLIFDGTFYKRKWRRKIIGLAKNKKTILVYFQCPLKTALLRNKKRRPSIPEKAVHIIYRQMEAPEKPDLAIDTGKTSASKAAAKILNYIKSYS